MSIPAVEQLPRGDRQAQPLQRHAAHELTKQEQLIELAELADVYGFPQLGRIYLELAKHAVESEILANMHDS